jgi:hypothetical protein
MTYSLPTRRKFLPIPYPFREILCVQKVIFYWRSNELLLVHCLDAPHSLVLCRTDLNLLCEDFYTESNCPALDAE